MASAGAVSLEKVARPELAQHESSILGKFHPMNRTILMISY